MLPSHNSNGTSQRLINSSTRDKPMKKLFGRRINLKRLIQYLIHPTLRHSPYRRTIIKVLVYLVLLAILVLTPYFVYNFYVRSVEKSFFQLHMTDDSSNSSFSSCMIPDYDPFDSSILGYLYDWDPIVCGRTQPYLTYVDWDGYIQMNQSGIEETGLSEEDYHCQYSEIVRRDGTDDKVDFMINQIFRSKEKLPSPFVLVKCVTSRGSLVYETGHAHIPPPSPELIEKTKKFKSGRPNVLILGLDSISRLNFIRQLPKTYKFLTKTLQISVFKGMTKVGDNTYPNMLTMLTGIAARKKEGVPGPVWGEKKAYGFFDDLPTVWKQYSTQGYITMYAEDLPEYSAFNYMAKGFLRTPTDYYMRPFWLAMDMIQNFRSSDSRCYGNVPQHVYLLNYTEEFVTKMRDLNYFAFSFLTGLSHNYINSVQVVDADLEAMLQRMHDRGDLHNTIVIVLGDHGNRFDNIRGTVIGRVEERMPFLGVSLPASMQTRYPHLRRGLEGNRETLISWYDVYELLMDVVMDNLGKESRVQRWGDLGYSLFWPVPPNRTCLQAGIPKEYCVCAREKQLDVREPLVVSVARDLVRHVNALLGEPTPCTRLMLARVISAQLLLPNAHLARPDGFVAVYRVTVRVAPSSGLLEGTLELDAWSRKARVVGEVNRINKYGNQSHCIRDKILQLYCFCSDLLHKPLPS